MKLFKRMREIIELYDDLFYSYKIKNNTLLGRRFDNPSDKIGIDFIATYDKDNVTFYYLITGLPRNLQINFKSAIRAECRSGVRVNFYNYIRGHNIDWNSAQMRSRLTVMRQVSQEKQNTDVNAYNLHETVSDINSQNWIEESLTYLAIADRSRRRELLKSTILMTISGKVGENFDKSVSSIEYYAKQLGIELHRVMYNIPEIVSYFSPFSRKYNKDVANNLPVHVMTDEILARFSTYSQGKVGVRGLYFGTDVNSKFPVMKVVKANPDSAEVWLVTAKTGGGKSFLSKLLILQLVGAGYNGTIMDIEGHEYIPLANFLSHKSKVVIINLADGRGNYVDPVEIFDKTGDKETDEKRKSLSIDFTISYFRTLLGKTYEENTWYDTIINDIVSYTYREAGVTEEEETWENSKGLTLFDIYNNLKRLREEEYREDEEYLNCMYKAQSVLSRYFEPDGTRAHILRDRVQIEDIIDADLVVCTFGMAGKSPQEVDETQMALMQLSAAHISHQRSIFSFSQGKFNFKIWEEVQRWGKFPNSHKTLGVAITGGRKLGDVNIVLTNDIKEILNEDRFSLFGNITSFLVGSIKDKDIRHELAERLGIPNMKHELDEIDRATSIDVDEDSEVVISKYTYSFLCGLDGNKFSVVRAEIPEELKSAKIFKSGVSQNKVS